MSQVSGQSIDTGFSVRHDVAAAGELAPWSIRVAAKLIDSIIVWGLFTLLWYLGAHYTAQGDVSTGKLFEYLSYAEGVLGFLWLVYETGKTGQSLGKRRMRTKLVGPNGQPLGFWHALLHETLQLFVDMLPLGIGYLWPLVSAKRQTFSDKIMGTQTFRVAPRPDAS